MLFNDLWFLKFIIATVFLVWSVPLKLRRVALLACCAIFHAHYAGPAGMGPILVLMAIVYYAYHAERFQRTLAITASIGALVFYKYSGFLNGLTGLSLPVIAAPLAVSFFVFEFVHLLSDRNQKKLSGKISPVDFGLFSIFFPSLAAGPIKRFQQFVPELDRLGRPAMPVLSQSLTRMLFGFFKKFCVAEVIARELPASESIGSWNNSILLLAICQGMRIYMDFSGYSDMAIGMAGLLNIRLPENFSFPYLATDISEFWRRWHISLSSWIRDYIYFVLGGSRKSLLWTAFNLLLAMALSGLWHGAAIHFVLWGLLQGFALLIHQLWRKFAPFKMHAAVAWAFTFLFVQLSWLVFFYDNAALTTLLKGSPFV